MSEPTLTPVENRATTIVYRRDDGKTTSRSFPTDQIGVKQEASGALKIFARGGAEPTPFDEPLALLAAGTWLRVVYDPEFEEQRIADLGLDANVAERSGTGRFW